MLLFKAFNYSFITVNSSGSRSSGAPGEHVVPCMLSGVHLDHHAALHPGAPPHKDCCQQEKYTLLPPPPLPRPKYGVPMRVTSRKKDN